ncbi:MAG: hypothetical protein ACM33T_15965 [Solirubrobacterales bacterium]
MRLAALATLALVWTIPVWTLPAFGQGNDNVTSTSPGDASSAGTGAATDSATTSPGSGRPTNPAQELGRRIPPAAQSDQAPQQAQQPDPCERFTDAAERAACQHQTAPAPREDDRR